jgi:hypothetical protein
MDIDELIRDLIQEDQFKAKYTNRQRSIFCQNMYGKISAFLQPHEEELKETQEKLKETQKKLEKYRKAYELLYKETDTYLFLTLVYAFICIVFFVYIYYDFILRPYLNP